MSLSIHSKTFLVQQLYKAFLDLFNTVLPHTSLKGIMSTFSFVTWQDTSVLCAINTYWLLLGLSEIHSFFPRQWSTTSDSKKQPSGTAPPCNHWCGYERPLNPSSYRMAGRAKLLISMCTREQPTGVIQVLPPTGGKKQERAKEKTLGKRKNKCSLFSPP